MGDFSGYVVPCAVNDPSHRKKGSYWQWYSGSPDEAWDVIANAVAAGWPSTAGALSSPEAELYGVVDGSRCWLYRVFPAGRDSFGRPGRYFSVVFQLQKPEDCLDPKVAGILSYFESERSLPLDCSALDNGVPIGTPSETLRKLASILATRSQRNHWGIDEKGSIRRFADVEVVQPPTRMPAHLPSDSAEETPSRIGSRGEDQRTSFPIIWFVAGVALGSVGGWLGGYRSAQVRQGLARAEKPQQNPSVPNVVTESPEDLSTQSDIRTPQETDGDSDKP